MQVRSPQRWELSVFHGIYPVFSLLCSQKTRGAAFSANPGTQRQAGTVTRAFLKIMAKKKDLPK